VPVIKFIIAVSAVAFFTFVVWMNFTPGHFQKTCECSAAYLTRSQALKIQNNLCPFAGVCPDSPLTQISNNFLLLSASLDLYK
jgi:hypothetical protein